MKVRIQKGKLEKFACDLLVVNEFKGVKKTGAGTGAVNKVLGGLIDRMIKDEGFEGKEGETMVVPVFRGGVKAKKVLVVGLGERKKFNADVVRKVSAVAVKKARQLKASKVGTILHGAGVGGLDPTTAARVLSEGSMLGAYAYVKYKSGKEQKEAQLPREVVIVDHGGATKIRAIATGIKEGQVYADATIFARELVNEPASNMTPKHLADTAREIVKAGPGMEVKILNRAQCEKLGMGAYLGVAKGSDHEPYFIHLVYRPAGAESREQRAKSLKRIALVGKGITFDSGGMSLKPAHAMESMKTDMAGCAAMLGLFSVIGQMKPNLEVHGISPVCENMPSGRAMKPGDIVRTVSGKTVEVLNTDAEGRLALADAFGYVQKFVKPDVMVDLATLTGACMVALGQEVAGYMGNNPKLLVEVKQAAQNAGERMWELPLVEEYREQTKSHVADLSNITPSRYAGAITAGLFLEAFVGAKLPWVHIDIAGPAWAEKEVIPYMPKGATGFGVRTMLEFLKSF